MRNAVRPKGWPDTVFCLNDGSLGTEPMPIFYGDPKS